MSEYAYIAVQACGCVTAATVDEPAHKASVAKDVASWVRRGLTVEHVTVEEARERLTFKWPCDHEAA